MSKLDELQVITEADVVLHCVGSRKEGILNYGVTDDIQTPLGRIRISMDAIQLDEVVGHGYDLNIWYPELNGDEYVPRPEDSIQNPETSTMFLFFNGFRLKPRKSLIYYAEEAEDSYNRFRYKWVWVIPVRYYDESADRYITNSHVSVLVADLRFGLPEYNNRAVPVLHIKLYEPVSIDSLRDADS